MRELCSQKPGFFRKDHTGEVHQWSHDSFEGRTKRVLRLCTSRGLRPAPFPDLKIFGPLILCLLRGLFQTCTCFFFLIGRFSTGTAVHPYNPKVTTFFTLPPHRYSHLLAKLPKRSVPKCIGLVRKYTQRVHKKVAPLNHPLRVDLFPFVGDFMQRRLTERRVNAKVEWCFVIGQCHGNGALFDVGTTCAPNVVHKVPIEYNRQNTPSITR